MLDPHYWPTPNGKKVTILLEELGTPSRVVPCDIGRGDQFEPAFLAMNSNHRKPVLVDHDGPDGAPITMFESGGNGYTVADMIAFPWTVNWKAQGQVIAEFKHFARWFEAVGARPAVQRGMAVGAELSIEAAALPPEKQERRAKLLYNQRACPAPG